MAQSTTPIPVIVFGKIPEIQRAVTEKLKPEYEVIKIFNDISTAIPILSAVMSATPISTHDPTIYPVPRVIIMGGGFPHTDFQIVLDALPQVQKVPWMRPAISKPGAQGAPPARGGPGSGSGPRGEVIAQSTRKMLDEKADVLRRGEGAGEIWWF